MHVRKTIAILALALGLSATAQAQNAWQTELGIQGGFTRLVQAGSGGGPIDAVSLPGFNLGPAAPFPSGLFLVIPWKPKLAIEPDFNLSELASGGGTAATLITLGLRGNYALSDRFYGAAGVMMGYIENSGTNDQQFGLQAALGYRRHFTGPLNIRAEARVTVWGKTDNLPPWDLYSVLIGVSTPVGGRRAAGTRAAAPARAGTLWSKAFGIAGGYVHMHEVGGGNDVIALALPGFGGALTAFGTPEATTPPTIFAIFPMGQKIALEPGLDIHRTQSNGNTVFAGTLQARLNYAFGPRWYGAVGGNLQYIKATGADATTRSGLNLGWGYRFPLVGSLGGRTELNYTMWGKNTDIGTAPVNTMGLMFAVTVPLK